MPVLVHDGAVHIESNDIIMYLESTFPTPQLIPAGHENEVAALLRHEDDLHLDLRTLSFRFVFAPPGPPKLAEALRSYAANGAGTVRGAIDRDKQIQIEFWERAAKEGFTDERARAAARRFRTELDVLDEQLAQEPFLMGDALSVLDIAWLIYAHRLSLAGYPLERLHPRVFAWKERLASRPEFAKEIGLLRIRASSSKPRAARRSRPVPRSKRSAQWSRRTGVRKGAVGSRGRCHTTGAAPCARSALGDRCAGTIVAARAFAYATARHRASAAGRSRGRAPATARPARRAGSPRTG